MGIQQISIEEAEEKHGIICEHSQMDNQELRFRLKKVDEETCYIRTESPPDGAWQRSHYHTNVLETYIVQKGWICYAEKNNENSILKIYKEGQLFTTKPNIIHNIYLPKNSVIHTVKHGNAIGEKRLEDENTYTFNIITQQITESQILASALKHEEFDIVKNNNEYSETYRHFDNLIWQVPTWSTGIFSAILLSF